MVKGERWSYCESKLHRLEYKKSIADAAVDGVVPGGQPTDAGAGAAGHHGLAHAARDRQDQRVNGR